ncbi:sulfotransferase family protein [Kitasatospora atroaurantiaca]|uniref:Sulfotransferase family protein n=2 Tax=Kitasatospora atroaurantiaca TaxID=285545 RepID=A0A561EHV5_9ACTN|nr:sulfotransferase family protein [Kitasatospora atroaurantiaca]
MASDRSRERRRAVLATFRRKGFAYVHVPKTGGFAMTRKLLDGIATEHATAAELREELGPAEWSRLFSFAFVREPAARFMSAFHYLKSGGMTAIDEEWARANLRGCATAEQFLHRMVDSPDLADWVHFRSQRTFLCDGRGQILVQFVGRFERLSEDFAFAARRISLPDPALSVLNKTSYGRESLSEWTFESRAQFTQFYRDDYSLFDYRPPWGPCS